MVTTRRVLPQRERSQSERRPGTAQQSDVAMHTPEEALGPLEHDDIRKLMNIAKSLRHLGIEASDLPIPKICVVGDQSTGKSSVIESISEIRTPRSSGTCTRCPIEINLSDDFSGSGWRCDVFLMLNYTYNPRSKKAASKANPLGNWIVTELEQLPFASTTSKDEVRDILACAQLAILNPGRSHDDFKPGSPNIQEAFQVPFSPNVVRVDINGPSLLNLSFYDLPGIISQDPDEDVPKLITNLVKTYIKPENTIILQTLTMNHDAANSNAASLIKQSKALHRTVGVLTKPDLFINDSLHEWQAILDGEKFVLDLGYYVVKNNPDSNVPHEAARDEEEQFFQTQQPFNDLLAKHVNKFGTQKLQAALSEMLAKEIKANLPTILSKVESKRDEIVGRLSRLPKPLEGNVSIQVDHKIREFSTLLGRELEGGALNCIFRPQWWGAAMKFADLIVCSYPLLKWPQPDTPAPDRNQTPSQDRISTPSRVHAAVVIDSDGEAEAESPSKRARLQDGSKKRAGETLSTAGIMHAEQLQRRQFSAVAKQRSKKFMMNEIASYVANVQTGIPSARNSVITAKIHSESIKHWQDLSQEFLRNTGERCEALIHDCIEEAFGAWRITPLYDNITRITQDFLRNAMAAQSETVDRMYRRETSKALTFDDLDMTRFQTEIKNTLNQQSLIARCKAYCDRQGVARERLSPQDIARVEQIVRQEPDPFTTPIEEMAMARGYYYISSRRFADNVIQSVAADLFVSLEDGLEDKISQSLGLHTAEANARCLEMLAVPSQVSIERKRLEKELAILEAGLRQMESMVVLPVSQNVCSTSFDFSEH